MVEPAIGITAAAIATLRPLFTRFLSVSRSHLNPTTATSSSSSHSLTTSSYLYAKESSRPSGDSRKTSGATSRTGPYGYSNEFAEMLGLSMYGVTTTVTAGGGDTRRGRRKRGRDGEMGRKGRMVEGDCESQTELRVMEGKREEDVGIKATTTVVIDF